MAQRLSLARQLLEDGDMPRALQFADPALYPVNTFGMNILDMLHEKDPAAADQRYLAILARAMSDPTLRRKHHLAALVIRLHALPVHHREARR